MCKAAGTHRTDQVQTATQPVAALPGSVRRANARTTAVPRRLPSLSLSPVSCRLLRDLRQGPLAATVDRMVPIQLSDVPASTRLAAGTAARTAGMKDLLVSVRRSGQDYPSCWLRGLCRRQPRQRGWRIRLEAQRNVFRRRIELVRAVFRSNRIAMLLNYIMDSDSRTLLVICIC